VGSHREVETAFEVPSDATLPDLDGVGGLVRVDRPEPDDLDAQYYDTDALDLVRAGGRHAPPAPRRRRRGVAPQGPHRTSG
jgi:hypothetical protein